MDCTSESGVPYRASKKARQRGGVVAQEVNLAVVGDIDSGAVPQNEIQLVTVVGSARSTTTDPLWKDLQRVDGFQGARRHCSVILWAVLPFPESTGCAIEMERGCQRAPEEAPCARENQGGDEGFGFVQAQPPQPQADEKRPAGKHLGLRGSAELQATWRGLHELMGCNIGPASFLGGPAGSLCDGIVNRRRVKRRRMRLPTPDSRFEFGHAEAVAVPKRLGNYSFAAPVSSGSSLWDAPQRMEARIEPPRIVTMTTRDALGPT